MLAAEEMPRARTVDEEIADTLAEIDADLAMGLDCSRPLATLSALVRLRRLAEPVDPAAYHPGAQEALREAVGRNRRAIAKARRNGALPAEVATWEAELRELEAIAGGR